jgi:glucose uptake protein GlcU
LLGGVPLAQGTVYLLMQRKTANRLTWVLVPFILIAAGFVLLTPLDYALVEAHRLSGKIIAWHWVRFFSPFINTYAFIFLVGGAILSAYRFHKSRQTYHRFIGNVFIAVGAILPGIGGTFTRFGYTEVLYVTELVGIVLIYTGYRYNVNGKIQDRDALASSRQYVTTAS